MQITVAIFCLYSELPVALFTMSAMYPDMDCFVNFTYYIKIMSNMIPICERVQKG